MRVANQVGREGVSTGNFLTNPPPNTTWSAQVMGRGVDSYQPESSVSALAKTWASEHFGKFVHHGEAYNKQRALGSDFIASLGGNMRGSAR